MDSRQRSISVLMLPWLAHGHVSPFMELAKSLTRKNFFIYFCSTPANLNSIKLSSKYSTSIELINLHLPSSPQLPAHYHTTKGLPPHLMPALKKTFDLAAPGFHKILKKLKPDLVIYDFLQPWAPAIALSLNIPAVHFLVTSAVMAAFLDHAGKNPGVEFLNPKVFIQDYMKPKFSHLLESMSNGMKDIDRVEECFERSSGIILIKSFRELEGRYIDYLSFSLNKKMVPVGPLVQDPDHEENNLQEMEIIKWLDKKEKNSTVLVSFGSEYFLSREEMEEIAHGLEKSEVNFIWVVRFTNSEEEVEPKDELPEGFVKRISSMERGMVVLGWAPQARVLAHDAVGGFVSHCGWSSIMEGMKFGVPIIAMPMQLDQPLNARLVEDVGIGIEVRRKENGELDKEEIARVIKEVMVEKTAEKVRRKAREMSEFIRKKDGEEIDQVVHELIKLCRATKIT